MLKVKKAILLISIFVIFCCNLHLICCSPINDYQLARLEAKKSNSAFTSIPCKSKDYGKPFEVGRSVPHSNFNQELNRMKITGIKYSGVIQNENYKVYRTVAETEDNRGPHSHKLHITTVERDNNYVSVCERSRSKQ